MLNSAKPVDIGNYNFLNACPTLVNRSAEFGSQKLCTGLELRIWTYDLPRTFDVDNTKPIHNDVATRQVLVSAMILAVTRYE
jgi:hypothetical protein